MAYEKLIPGIILLGIGVLFILNNKNIAKGAYALYQKLYTEKNLKMMFRIAGVFLIVGGALIIFID